MHASITIGDNCLVVTENSTNGEHLILALDNVSYVVQARAVASEVLALEVINDFLRLDKPVGLYGKLFTHGDLNPNIPAG